MPSGYVKRGHKKCRMAASPVRPAKDESTGRPDKRSAIRLGNIKAIYSLSVGLTQGDGREIVEQRDIILYAQFHHRRFLLAADGLNAAVELLGDFGDQETLGEQA